MVFMILPLLIAVAFSTLAERKVIGGMQRRRGPNVVGLFGLLQPIADAAKLLLKETVRPSSANGVLFALAPLITFTLAITSWALIPVNSGAVISDVPLGMLGILAISSLGVYGIILAGWASNSKYAFLGALRSAAQMVSYEVSIGFIVVSVLLCVGSFNLSEIVLAQASSRWFMLPLMPLGVLFFISALAETNRHPFDLPEAEAELVAGYNVEYSAMGFALFFLGEYANILIISLVTALLFLGGASGSAFGLGIKVSLLYFIFLWARAALPRYRYDQLMRLGWKIFLPLSLGSVLAVGGTGVSLGSLAALAA
jgi:NADH-quinone oxidoreductase subunit H